MPRHNQHIATLTPLQWVGRAVLAAAEKKASNPVILEVFPFLAITDYFLICSAQSDRQVKTIAEEVEGQLKKDGGLRPLRTEGSPDGGWLLVDYGIFVVHVFTEEMREFYDLERLWKDAPRPEIPELAEAREASA